jgi:hypothetical protein
MKIMQLGELLPNKLNRTLRQRGHDFELPLIQQFASKHKPQTFSRVCLRLKRGVYRWKRNVSLLM